jgi:hypothetical protein
MPLLGPLSGREIFELAAVAIATMLVYRSRKEISEALRNFSGRGPRPPSHPLPADDAFILRRRKPTTKTI